MSWKLIGKPQTVKVTRKLAQEYATMDPPPHERPLSERRLAVYEKLIRQGHFRPVIWATARCKETHGTYRVNGQHTSTLLSGLEDIPEFWAVIERYQCDTLEDVAKLYATFDSQMQSRSVRDINYSFAGTVPELAQVAVHTIGLAVSGIAHHLGTWRTETPAERAEKLLDYPDFVVWLQNMYAGRRHDMDPTDRSMRRPWNCRHLQRRAVAAAMFATWQRDHDKAEEFWAAVRDETGASPKVPDRFLGRYLLAAGTIASSAGGRVRIKKSDWREMYVKCLHAWNAWRAGETTALKYTPTAAIPEVK